MAVVPDGCLVCIWAIRGVVKNLTIRTAYEFLICGVEPLAGSTMIQVSFDVPHTAP